MKAEQRVLPVSSSTLKEIVASNSASPAVATSRPVYKSPGRPAMLMELGPWCPGSACPKIFESDRGTYVVQGYVLDAPTKDTLTLPEGESAVEIPVELIERIIAARQN